MILPRLTLLFGMHLFLVKKKIMSLILLVQYLIVQLDSTCHLINHSEETCRASSHAHNNPLQEL